MGFWFWVAMIILFFIGAGARYFQDLEQDRKREEDKQFYKDLYEKHKGGDE